MEPIKSLDHRDYYHTAGGVSPCCRRRFAKKRCCRALARKGLVASILHDNNGLITPAIFVQSAVEGIRRIASARA